MSMIAALIQEVQAPDKREITDLAKQLGAGGALLILTTAIHGIGLSSINRTLGLAEGLETRFRIDPTSFRGVGFMTMVVLGIFVLHFLQILLYALFFWWNGALHDFGQALFFSTITFGTVGYDDAGLANSWRMVAAVEGINGVVLLGWSTAFFVNMISRVSHYGSKD